MAKLFGEIAAKSILTLDKAFARANGQPLDSSEIYYSLKAAQDYAKTDIAYIGQKIVVIENGVVTHYSVEDTTGTLKELGSKPVADGTTISIDEDGKITLANIADKAEGTYNAVLVNGELTWVKPSETTVEGLSDLIAALTTRVDTAESDIDSLEAKVKVLEEKEDKDTTYSVAEGEKVLKLNGTTFGTELSLKYNDNRISLLGINNIEISSFDASAFVVDGVLRDVTYDADNNKLVFVWNTIDPDTADYKKIEVNVEDLVDTYTASGTDGTTITLTATTENNIHNISAEVKANSLTNAHIAANAAIEQTKINGLTDSLNAKLDASVAESDYAKKTELTNYATTTALEEVSTVANNASVKADNLEDKIKEITEVGGEPNSIEYISVNGQKLTPSEDDKTVNIEVPTKFTDLTDDSGFGDRITTALNQANQGVADAAGALTAANNAQNTANANAETIGTHSTKITALEEAKGGHETRIIALENADTQHASEYTALQSIVNGHTDAIAKAAKQTDLDAAVTRIANAETALANRYTKAEADAKFAEIDASYTKDAADAKFATQATIGTVTEGKTIVEMIADAKAEATYDDTAVKALITAEETRAKGIEENLEQRVAEVETFFAAIETPDETIDTLAEIVKYIESDKSGASAMAADIKQNTDAIAAINNTSTGILATAKEYTNAQIAAIPAATAEALGLVKYDNATIKMNNSNQLYVAAVSTDLLTQGNQELILNGGSAV